VIKSFFSFLRKAFFGQYDEMVWADLFNLIVLMMLITGGLVIILR
jgi:hypothetical protein